MADNGVWFKLWCASDDDGDLDNLDISDYGRWCKFGTHTKRHGTAGLVKIISPARTLCSKFQVANFAELEAIIMRFPHVQIVERNVTNAFVTLICRWENWQKYQVDNSTERVRKFRQSVTTKKRREEIRRDETRKEDKKPAAKGVVYTIDFERAWKINGNGSKLKALEAWNKAGCHVSTDERDLVIHGLAAEAEWRERAGAYKHDFDLHFFIPSWAHLSTWINQKRWEQTLREIPTGGRGNGQRTEPKGFNSIRKFIAIRDSSR